jgi:2-iminoacetate synthase ThiH
MQRPVAALTDPESGLAADVLPRGAGSSRPADTIAGTAPAPGVHPSVSARAGTAARGTGNHTTENKGRADSVPALAAAAASDPLALDDHQWVRLLEATGSDLDALTEAADNARRYTVGEAIGIAVNRNLTSSGFRARPLGEHGTFGLDDVAAIAADAWDLGATELCVQGLLPDSEDPRAYLDIARAVKAATPGMHLHAFRPQDVWDLADRGGLGLHGAIAALQDAGVDTFPGTGVKVLSERVRTRVAPSDLGIDRWREAVTALHAAGLRSTSVLFYGHVETAAERIAHLRLLREIQDASPHRAGFTEFVPIPLPGPAGGVPLVASRPALDEHRAMVAVSRLLLSGSIPHVQIPWTRVGTADAAVLLRSGGDDLGGTLLDGRVLPEAGIEHGLELPLADAARLVGRLFRPFRQRTTEYREPSARPRSARAEAHPS